jgi:hypothetical protein
MSLEQSRVKAILMSAFPRNIRPKNVIHHHSMKLIVRKPGQSGGSRKNILLSLEDRHVTIDQFVTIGQLVMIGRLVMTDPLVVIDRLVVIGQLVTIGRLVMIGPLVTTVETATEVGDHL